MKGMPKINSIHFGAQWILISLFIGLICPFVIWIIWGRYYWIFSVIGGISLLIFIIVFAIEMDKNEMFKSVDGQYKVKDVKVYNRKTGLYEDLDLEKEYQLGGINYLLRNSGNGLCMFADNNLTVDYVGQDYVILAEYMGSFAQDDNGVSVVNTANSPLASYGGYMIDYENPLGAGRINIENLNY